MSGEMPLPPRSDPDCGQAMSVASLPLVSIGLVVRNEEETIIACLDQLALQLYPVEQLEVIAVDGESTDSTRALVEAYDRLPLLRILDNPKRTQPAGLNLALAAARGDVFCIVDGHAFLPRNYFQRAVQLLNETGAQCVGGRIETVPGGKGMIARMVAWCLSSRFGVGGSRFRVSSASGFVDTVPYGVYRRDVFDEVGWFDERLTRNFDVDLHHRMARAGMRFYIDGSLVTQYVARSTLRGMALQAYGNGYWIGRIPTRARIRHLVPLAFVTALALSLLVAALGPPAGIAASLAALPLAMLVASYGATAMAFSLAAARPVGAAAIILGPITFLVLHASYGIGTLAGISTAWRSDRHARSGPIRP